MAQHKYMILLRSPASSGASPGERTAPSPEQMQQMFAAYGAWKAKFQDRIVDMGDKLASGGRVVRASGVAEGPFVEAKEIIAGFMIVTADDYDGAVEVVRACPAMQMPGVIMEVREMSGMKM